MRTKWLTLTTALAVLAALLSTPSVALAHRHHHHHHHHRHHHRRRHNRRHAPRATSSGFWASAASSNPLDTTSITGTTYYVSPNGNDSNSGTSPSQAWQTVYRVNKARLSPGDGVLFQGGAAFSDQTLMPGWGTIAGTAVHPIVFGSYGSGAATLPKGIWISGSSYLAFENLDLGPTQGFAGTGNDVLIENCSMTDPRSDDEIGINAIGSNWLIRNNTIDETGDSGMLIRGDHFVIAGNRISNAGTDSSINYGKHGIYLKASNSSAIGNVIDNSSDSGISVRYRNSTVADNTINGAQFGITWFQYDSVAGTSRWINNTIENTAVAGFYVSSWDDVGGDTRESFVISGNTIVKGSNAIARYSPMALDHTSGKYSLSQNSVRS